MPAYCTACPCLFIVCMGTSPGLATASYRWTSHHTSLTSHSSQFHPEAPQGESSGFCCRPWLHPGLALCGAGPPLLCAAVEPRQKMEEQGGLSLASGFIFSCSTSSPMSFFDWSRTKGSKLPLCPHKPTRMKVTSHWFHAKVQSCTLAPQLHYSESQASLVSRNAFRVDLFRISRIIFYLCVFPHLRAAPGSTVGGLLVFKQLCLVPETETTLLWAHLRQHLYFSEGANPSSLLSNAIAKFSFPKTEPWYAMGILSGASASSLCTWRVLLSSVKEGPVYSSEQPGSDNNLISLLHAVVFKCQIAIRAECSDQVRSLVTVWLALLSPCARWMRNTHQCFPRYFLCVFKNFLKWAWYLCFSIWRHGHVVGFFHVFTDIYIYIRL